MEIAVPSVTFSLYDVDHDGNRLFSFRIDIPGRDKKIAATLSLSRKLVETTSGNPPPEFWFQAMKNVLLSAIELMDKNG